MLTRSENDAHDIAQRVFVELWEKRDRIDPQKNVKGFLFTTARFYTLNFFDHQKVQEKYRQFKLHNDDIFGHSLDEVVIGKETELVLKIAISKMPGQRQKVFRMKFEEGLSNDEIADRLGLSYETVKGHVKIGKKELRKVLESWIGFLLVP